MIRSLLQIVRKRLRRHRWYVSCQESPSTHKVWRCEQCSAVCHQMKFAFGGEVYRRRNPPTRGAGAAARKESK